VKTSYSTFNTRTKQHLGVFALAQEQEVFISDYIMAPTGPAALLLALAATIHCMCLFTPTIHILYTDAMFPTLPSTNHPDLLLYAQTVQHTVKDA
jgi:hypothetical protein